jgi:hypothetical protein
MVMDHVLLILKVLHKDQDHQKIETNNIIMKWPWILITWQWTSNDFFKKIKSQMVIAMVYSVHNTTMMRFSFQKA